MVSFDSPTSRATALAKQGQLAEALDVLAPFRAQSLSAKSLAKDIEHQAQAKNALFAVGILQAFFSEEGRTDLPPVLENLGGLVKQGQNLESAFQALNPAQQKEIREKVGAAKLKQVFSIAQNTDPEIFWQETIHFGVRLKQELELEKAAGVLSLASQDFVPAELRGNAEAECNAILGKGSSGLRSEVLLSTLAKEATSYKAILPMVGASILGQTVGTYVLGRLAGAGRAWYSAGVGARLIAGTAGFISEVSVFGMSTHYLSGSKASLAEDWGRAALSLGALRVFGFLGNQSFLKLHGFNEMGVPMRLSALAKFNQLALPQAFIFGGLMFSHKAEESLGLRDKVDGATTVTDTLGSMVTMSVGSKIGHEVLGANFARFQKEMGLRTDVYTKFGDLAGRERQEKREPVLGKVRLAGNPLLAPLWMMMSMGGIGSIGSGGGDGGGWGEGEFRIGIRNPTDVVRNFKELRGESVETLEARMRPNSIASEIYLGPRESVRETMSEDNDFVLAKNLTHQEIAEDLKLLAAQSGRIEFRGETFAVEAKDFEKVQDSPFRDGTKGYQEITVTNLANGKSLRFSTLLPEMIQRYGFYSGKGSSYRVEPSQILEVITSLNKVIEEVKERVTMPQGELMAVQIPFEALEEEGDIKERVTLLSVEELDDHADPPSTPLAEVTAVLEKAKTGDREALIELMTRAWNSDTWYEALKDYFSDRGALLTAAEKGDNEAKFRVADLAVKDEIMAYYVLLAGLVGQEWTIPALAKLSDSFPVAAEILFEMSARSQASESVLAWAIVGDRVCQEVVERAARESSNLLGILIKVAEHGELWAKEAVDRLLKFQVEGFKPSWVVTESEGTDSESSGNPSRQGKGHEFTYAMAMAEYERIMNKFETLTGFRGLLDEESLSQGSMGFDPVNLMMMHSGGSAGASLGPRTTVRDFGLGTQAVILEAGKIPSAEAIQKVVNAPVLTNKPSSGGFWTSSRGPDEAIHEGFNWTSFAGFNGMLKAESHLWHLKPQADAKLFTVRNAQDFQALMEVYGRIDRVGMRLIDFEKLAQDFDGLHVSVAGLRDMTQTILEPQTQGLYGWDCEQTLWFRWAFESAKDQGKIPEKWSEPMFKLEADDFDTSDDPE